MYYKKALILFILSFIGFSGFGQNNIRLDATVIHEALIYPNPLVGENFQIKSKSEITKVEVVNVIGKLINRTTNKSLKQQLLVNIGSCDKGLYLVKITFDDKRTIIKKLLKK